MAGQDAGGVLYTAGKAQVTARLVRSAGGRSIPLAGIAAAEVQVLAANRAAGLVVAVVGLLVGGSCLATGSESQLVGLVFGGMALAVGLTMALSAHERFVVRVVGAGGKSWIVLGTDDRTQAEGLAAAIEQAADGWRGRGAPPAE
jgi:hypothetical protein